MQPRLLVVSDYGWVTGGTEEFVWALLTAARERYTTELLTWASSHAPYPGGLEVNRVDNGDVLRVWSSIAQADAVIVVTSFNMRMLARVAAEALGQTQTPTVTVVQTSAHSSPGAASSGHQVGWLRELLQQSRAVVGASAAVTEALDDLVADVDLSASITTIDNGARLLDTRMHPRGRRNVLFIGRPTDSKGYPVFLRAVRELAHENISFSANTVSVPPDVTDSQVSYSRCLNNAQLLDLFAATDLVVAPYWRADGLPLALLEVLNCGVPVLGFDSPAVGPLLRRYQQHVVPCETRAMIGALRDWRSGSLLLHPPIPGQVPSLLGQARLYIPVVDRVLCTPVVRSVRIG